MMPHSRAMLRDSRRLNVWRSATVAVVLLAAVLVGNTSLAAAASATSGCGSTNLALGKVATASSSASGTQTPAKAVDGNTSGKWLSAVSDPQWLQVDLGASQNLCGATLDWANYASAFAIQISDDATSWVNILSSGASGNNPQTLPVSGTGRYIRMYGTARGNANNGYGLHEFEVFGPAVPEPPTFTSPATARFTGDYPGSFIITTSGDPAVSSITESGSLPTGLSYTDHGDGTATLTGTPTGTATSWPVTLTATNGVSPDATQALTIQVARPGDLIVSSTSDVAINFGACGNSGQILPTGGSLREAICAANNYANTQAVTINVPGGTYRLSHGELQMGKVSGSNITLTGGGPGVTIVDAGGSSRVFDLDPGVVGGVTTSISGVTITNGRDFTFGGAGIIAGSGPVTSGDTLTISNSSITNNTVNSTTSNTPGGGVQFEGGSLTITNSTISNNSSGSSKGSGVEYTAEGTAAGEQLTVTGTTFSGNTANASVANVTVGGALATASAGGVPITVSNDKFLNNTVVGSGTGIPQGGGIFAQGGALTVTGSTFTGNSATGGSNPAGGAISTVGGTAALHYNRITGNLATTASGARLAATGSIPNASENWWGCNTGPGTAGCNSVDGGPTVSPRLVLTATASPSHVIGLYGTATINASLLTDSAGGAVDPADLGAFNTLPVTFADPPGDATVTIIPGAHTANFAGGVASIDYHSNTTLGPDDDPVSLDNATVSAALEVDRAPTITSADHITFTAGSAGSFTVTTAPCYPTAVSLAESGALPSGVSFTDNGDGTATIAGTPGVGSGWAYGFTVTAGNGINPDATQAFTLTVTEPPRITSANHATFTVNAAGSFAITTTEGFPTATTLTETGALPAGITFTDNGDGTATVSGTPAGGTGGSYPLTITASNGVNPDATQAFVLTVSSPPVITSANHTTFAAGSAGSFTVTTAAGFPVASALAESGTLPAGITFTDNGDGTATIAGTPAAGSGGGYSVLLRASNGVSPSPTQAFTLTVEQPPIIG
jgi:hypothetical protein